jgi:pseudouridine synthase
MLHKPVGYVCSRDGQGSKTIYDLLPTKLHQLKPVGRLDKDSSGLLLLTNDGELANRLTHPSFEKEKVYEISLDKPLARPDRAQIEQGVLLEDGLSKLQVKPLGNEHWQVTMREGRNRQIRRTFSALGYRLQALHRTQFGTYRLGRIAPGEYTVVQYL